MQKSLDRLRKNMEEHGGYHESSGVTLIKSLEYLKTHTGHSPYIEQPNSTEPTEDVKRIIGRLNEYDESVQDSAEDGLNEALSCVNLIQSYNVAAKEAPSKKEPQRPIHVRDVVSAYKPGTKVLGRCPGILPGEVVYFVKFGEKTPLNAQTGKPIYIERFIEESDGRQAGVGSEQYKRGVFAEGAKSIILNARNVEDLPQNVYADVLDGKNPELSDAYVLVLRPMKK